MRFSSHIADHHQGAFIKQIHAATDSPLRPHFTPHFRSDDEDGDGVATFCFHNALAPCPGNNTKTTFSVCRVYKPP